MRKELPLNVLLSHCQREDKRRPAASRANEASIRFTDETDASQAESDAVRRLVRALDDAGEHIVDGMSFQDLLAVACNLLMRMKPAKAKAESRTFAGEDGLRLVECPCLPLW